MLALLLCAAFLTAPCPASGETDGGGSAPAGDESALCVKEAPEVSAVGAVLFERDSKRMLAGVNEHAALPMASTTKIMTALLAVECCDLDETVEVADCAVGVGGSSIYLNRGETMSMRDLLYGLMLTSGNDAAVAIAVHIDGSVEAFSARMNARAAEIGCRDTCFANPNGLPDDAHYTTAYDLGLIAATAMQNETFRTVVSTTYYQTTTGDYIRTFKNKNRLLWQYEGGCGVKTGYTKAAGNCLVFSAERGGMTLVGVLLNAPERWKDAAALLDYGFASVSLKTLVDAERPLASVAVTGGEKKELAVYPKEDILYPTAADGSDEIDWAFDAYDAIAAPVTAGQTVGELRLRVNGVTVKTVSLVVREDAAAAGWIDYFRRVLEDWAA